MLELRLAWRNVWRSPRRTGITLAATVFAVLLVVTFVAMAAGSHEKMIEDSVRLHSGHMAVMAPGYLENRTLDEYVELDAELVELVESTEGIRGWAPRVLGFALLSKDAATQGVALLGVDPVREPTVTTLAERLVEGRFVESGDARDVVLGSRLARNLGARIGDEVLLYSVAYTMESAYELFEVVGIVNLMEPALDRSTALIALDDAQAFFVYGDRVSEVAILADDADEAPPVEDRLLAALGGRTGGPVVHPWNELLPELEQFVLLDDAGMFLLLVVLVVVVAFGILNTLLMSVLERSRELGVALALGLRPAAVFRMVYWESMMISGLGLVVGLALAIPLVLYFQAHPIPLTGDAASGAMDMFGIEPVITWKLKPLNPIGSTITILGVAALAALYPAFKASRAEPAEALRSL